MDNNWIYIAIITVSLIWLLNRGVDYLWPAPKKLKSLKKEWYWSYIITNFVFAFISSTGSILCIYQEPELLHDLANGWSLAGHNLNAFSLGFFACDLWESYLHSPKAWFEGLLPHHAFMVVGHSIACSSRKYTGFGTIVLLMEVNNIFRNLGRLFRETQLDRSMKYRFLLIISLLTNVVCRFFVIIRLFCFILTQWGTASIFHFLVGFIGLIYTFHLSTSIFRNTWKKLVTSRENACHDDADGYDLIPGKQKSNED